MSVPSLIFLIQRESVNHTPDKFLNLYKCRAHLRQTRQIGFDLPTVLTLWNVSLYTVLYSGPLDQVSILNAAKSFSIRYYRRNCVVTFLLIFLKALGHAWPSDREFKSVINSNCISYKWSWNIFRTSCTIHFLMVVETGQVLVVVPRLKQLCDETALLAQCKSVEHYKDKNVLNCTRCE